MPQAGPKNETQTRGHNSADLHFFTGRFSGKAAVNLLVKILPHMAYVATQLPCEALVSENNESDNSKLQGSVATHLVGLLVTAGRGRSASVGGPARALPYGCGCKTESPGLTYR